jgi:hypothetical protein
MLGCRNSFENGEVMFLQLFVLVLQDLKALLAVGDVGRGRNELVRLQDLLQLRQLTLLFLELRLQEIIKAIEIMKLSFNIKKCQKQIMGVI